MVLDLVVRRTPESLLRFVGLLHRLRWEVEELAVEPAPAPTLQRVHLRLRLDDSDAPRVRRVLQQNVDVVEVLQWKGLTV